MRVDLSRLTHSGADWAGLSVLVTGLGVSGLAAADALLERGCRVVVVDAGTGGQVQQERAELLRILGAEVLLGRVHVAGLPTGSVPDLLVTSPGWPPHHPVLAQAAAAGVPIWSEPELAWRMRPEGDSTPWLVITGTNGKTTTVQMSAAILRAAGLRAVAAGNVGTPLLEAVLHPEPYRAIAVELSSFQLHFSHTISPLASVCLNLAPDHLDWHGSFESYAADKARVYERTRVAAIYTDATTEQMVREADVVEGCRAIGVSTAVPGLSMLGVVDDVLADRAFIADRATSAAELGTIQDIATPPVPDHLVIDALAAAALTRAAGVPAVAVREGLRTFSLDAHRGSEVASVAGVRYLDDSKATNPHAAAAALAAHEAIVWIAGGQLKGAAVDALVAQAADRLRAVVLLGQDADVIAAAVARHAPDVPVVSVSDPHTGVMALHDSAPDPVSAAEAMERAVRRASDLARPGDVVLLAPAAASYDMFSGYAARGDAFVAAVQRLQADR